MEPTDWYTYVTQRQKWCLLNRLLAVCTLHHIARRHGHVFRMALHNEGDWRMETWQRACRASCHVSIRQSPRCVMPFWTHANAFSLLYHTFQCEYKPNTVKTVYRPRFYGGTYLQAKHADVCCGVLFWTACTRRPHVLSLPSSSGCEKSDSWRQARSVKTAKKVMNGTTMWSCDTELCTNGVEATKCWVFVTHFSIYSNSRCRCHTGTDIPRLRGHTLQINQVVRTVSTGFLVAHQLYIGNVMRKYKIGKSSPHQPCENTCHSNVLELSLLWMARALACF